MTPPSHIRVRDERGFTLVESLVATFVLAVGLLSTFMMLTVNLHTTADAKAREGGVTLARQITEDARSIPYSQLSGSTIVSQLQAMPGLQSTSAGSSWTIVRNGLTYTVAANVSTLHDPKDTSGAETVDIKQVGATVSWTVQGKVHQVTETTAMSSAGQDPGLIASGLALAASQQGAAGISGPANGTAPVVTSTAITSLQFQVTAPTATTAIVWTLNGGKQSTWNGSAPSTGTTWTSAAWPLSGLSDGTYTVGAQAEDASGVAGPPVTLTVRLIRNVPSAPNVTGYGFDPNVMVGGQATLGADLQWAANPEMNVVGYRIYQAGVKICETSTTAFSSNCGTNAWCSTPTACVDLAANASNTTYTVKALYYDANNVLREGSPQTVTLASGTPVPPPPVPQVSMSVVTSPDDTAILTWSPPAGGTPVSFYRIYRGGNNYGNRYDIVAASACSTTCTYHDTNRTTQSSYWVTAVGGTSPGSDMAESVATGPVTG